MMLILLLAGEQYLRIQEMSVLPRFQKISIGDINSQRSATSTDRRLSQSDAKSGNERSNSNSQRSISNSRPEYKSANRSYTPSYNNPRMSTRPSYNNSRVSEDLNQWCKQKQPYNQQ